ncbi:MAG: nuclear transport factor 2 family protein [Mycobacterium sp.]
MTENQTEIRDLVHRWVAAIQARDMEALLADHADDIVMFDVPPPYGGVRGIDRYRDCWPPFFEFIAGGAFFDIVELDITAGDTAAYAYALLRCGTAVELTAKPGLRLRLTLGLRKHDGRWQVAHEHHSFPLI